MIKITVNKSDLDRVFSAIAEVKRLVTQQLPRELTYIPAKEFADVLRENIENQKFGDFGVPRMSNWKEGYPGVADDYWLFLGTVLKSIRSWQTSDGATLVYRVGFQ